MFKVNRYQLQLINCRLGRELVDIGRLWQGSSVSAEPDEEAPTRRGRYPGSHRQDQR